MRVLRLRVLCLMPVLLAAGILVDAAPASRKSPPRRQSAPRSSRWAEVRVSGKAVAKQAVARAKSVPSRRAVVAALLGTGLTKAKLEALARAKNLPATRLQTRSLSGARLAPPLALRAPVIGALLPLSQTPAYDEIDWDSGVFLAPVSLAPWFKDGTDMYRFATMTCYGIHTTCLMTLADMYRQDVLVLNRDRDGAAVFMKAEIPPGQATYVATIKLMGEDGSTFTEVVAGRSLRDVFEIEVLTGVSHLTPDVALLPDGSGVSAMFTGDIRTMGYGEMVLPGLQMRDITCSLSWCFKLDHQDRNDLIFGGIKIERL